METPTHFVMELTGLSNKRRSLDVRKLKAKSVDTYVQNGDTGPPLFGPPTEGVARDTLVSSMAFATSAGWSLVTQRFPYIQGLYPSPTLLGGDITRLMDMSKLSCGRFENLLLVNQFGSSAHFRYLTQVVVALREEEGATYRDYLKQVFADWPTVGVRSIPADDVSGVRAMQFASVYSSSASETTIGAFLAQNRETLLAAFGATDCVIQPRLEWLDGTPSKTIIPDLFLKRLDGTWDICDLKLVLATRRTLTTGPRERRSPISPVGKGLAQLAHYAEYFTTPLNAENALRKYQIRVDNPRKILVIGSMQNFDASEVHEALRMHDQNCEVISYDSLTVMYLAGMGWNLPSATTRKLLPIPRRQTR
ncbi:MAG: hypothetical protein QM804_07370 [Propionicimonas sp.]